MPDAITTASTPDDYADFARLVHDYVAWARARYEADAWLIDGAFSHQSLAGELASLQATYGAPNGVALLARRDDGRAVACGAYHRLPDGSCEMKRLFVAASCQGQGIGRSLCAALVASARAEGYRLMRLDTGDRLSEAIAMYQSMGFRRCPPYQHYPPDVMRHIVFMEMPLTDPDTGPAGR